MVDREPPHPGRTAAEGPRGFPPSEHWLRSLPGASGCAPCPTGATMAMTVLGWGTRWEGRRTGAKYTGHPRLMVRPACLRGCGSGRTPASAAVLGATEGLVAPQGVRGWRERVSSDLSSAVRKEGRKRGRLKLHGRFLPAAAQCTAGKPRQGPSSPAAPCTLPHARRRWGSHMGMGMCWRCSGARWQWLAAPWSPGAGPAGALSKAGAGRGSQAVHHTGGLAGGLKITLCECPAGLGPQPRPVHNRRKHAGIEHCFAADARFLCPAVGTLLSPAQRGCGAGARPPWHPARCGWHGHRWLSPGSPSLCPGMCSLPGVPAQCGRVGRGLCGVEPPASWTYPAHAAFPVPALASSLPASGVPAAAGDGKGGSLLLMVLPVPPTGMPWPVAPR